MAELTPSERCSAVAQASCCAPEDKGACCGERSDGCGCAAAGAGLRPGEIVSVSGRAGAPTS